MKKKKNCVFCKENHWKAENNLLKPSCEIIFAANVFGMILCIPIVDWAFNLKFSKIKSYQYFIFEPTNFS